jgi:hypothetical protein
MQPWCHHHCTPSSSILHPSLNSAPLQFNPSSDPTSSALLHSAAQAVYHLWRLSLSLCAQTRAFLDATKYLIWALIVQSQPAINNSSNWFKPSSIHHHSKES